MADNSKGTASSVKRGRGKPFVKGDPRINRGGRPRMPDDVRIAFAGAWPKAVDRLLHIIEHSENEAAIIKAAEIILNRACGTPTEGGALKQIADATVSTGEFSPVDMEQFMIERRIPDAALQAAAMEATRAAIDDIAGGETANV